MANPKERWLDDIDFIFAEIARLRQEMHEGGFRSGKIDKDEFWYQMPHSGRGVWILGRAGGERLRALSEYVGKSQGLANRAAQDLLIKITGQVLVERFVDERREISIQQFDRAVNEIGKRVRKECSDIVHWLPCHLMHANDPDEIVLGPVKFRHRRTFGPLLAKRIATYGRRLDRIANKGERARCARAVRYYRSFKWVAEVEVKGCDRKTSALLAERAVTSALDCLQLVLGAKWTERMSVGGPSLKFWDFRAHLSATADGGLNVGTSNTVVGQVNFDDGWSEAVIGTGDAARLMSLCSVALEAAASPDLKRPMSRRFLDAAQWFGEAVRDDRPATSIVKYVTALERMLMTNERDDIASLVSTRVAALCSNEGDAADWNKWHRDAVNAYDLRSRLVHGAISPLDLEARREVWRIAKITEHSLLGALSAMGPDALRADAVSAKKVAIWFNNLVAHYRPAGVGE